MSLDPKSLQYTSTHEWIHLEDGPGGVKTATVGVSDFAIHALTDLVHIELPEPGRGVQAGKPFGEVESVKAVSDLYSPVDGEVVEVNKAVAQNLDIPDQRPLRRRLAGEDPGHKAASRNCWTMQRTRNSATKRKVEAAAVSQCRSRSRRPDHGIQ